jgi:outer membrane protein TolC
MSLLAAVVLALFGALGTGWIVWLRREHERDNAALADQGAALSVEVSALRTSVDSLRLQVVALRGDVGATNSELADFIHGPPSLRAPREAS